MFEPANEMGVVVYFAQEIAGLDQIDIVDVGIHFPDATLRVHGAIINVEFEFTSKNFVRHGHDPRECDLIICWIDDLVIRNKLPIWELSSMDLLEAVVPAMVSDDKKEASYWECRAMKAENRWTNTRAAPPIPDRIIARRKQIKEMRKRGSTRQEVADELNVSLGTIKNDLRIINGKVSNEKDTSTAD